MAEALVRAYPANHIQTHVDENLAEIELARELFPNLPDYLGIYERYHLLGPKTLLGHCIHLTHRECEVLTETRSVAVWCPTSNLFIGSGLFDRDRLKTHGARIAVATDIGGGTSYSMLQTLDEGYKVLQLRGQRLDPLSSFYMMTLGNARAMSLDDAYLVYPRRREGMDHDHYPYSNLFARPPLRWLNGVKVATTIVISLEWFPILPSDTPFRAPGHMQTAYPDYRHYTSREYGTRVGFYRLLDALGKVGARAGVATNAAIAERYPSIVADVVAAGHEVIAHSIDMNGAIATGLPEADERDLLARSFDTLERVSGIRPRGWLSIARSQSWNTARLRAESGASYMLDWANDDLPYRFATQAGALIDVPLNHELSDRQVITVQQQSADSYGEQLRDAWRLGA